MTLPRVEKICDLDSKGRPIFPVDSATQAAPIQRRKLSVSGGLARAEVLTDERFERRHEAYEKHEKRRKKWNSHSTRFELEMAHRRVEAERKEALRLGLIDEEEPEGLPPREPFSFWPNLRPERGIEARDELKALKIEVCETLPVTAFGVPVVLNIKRKPFSLPKDGPNAILGLDDVGATDAQ